MAEMTDTLIRLGILPPELTREFKRWPGQQIPEAKEKKEQTPATADAAVTAIREVLEGGDQVQVRETDPDLLQQFNATRKRGRLHLVLRNLKGEVQDRLSHTIEYGKTPLGEYIIPWDSESILDYITDDESYLKVDGVRIKFGMAREMFYGHDKAFIVASPVGGPHAE